MESIYTSHIDPNSAKVIPTRTHTAKSESGTCSMTALAHHLVPLASASTKAAKFRLLSLPIELRRMIYRYYFHNPFDSWISKYRLVQDGEYCNIFCLKKCHIQILSVNHQLHDEAIESLYGETTWHFSFKSFDSDAAPKTVHGTFLRRFSSRPGFRFIRNVTIGVMFLTVVKLPRRPLENRSRLRINRKLLRKICRMLRRAPDMQTVKLLWHDCIRIGDWEKKQTCLSSLSKLPEKVKCKVFLGRESADVHFPENPINSRMGLSVEEEIAKAKLNQYLNAVRLEYQASIQHKSPEGSETTSTQYTTEQSSV